MTMGMDREYAESAKGSLTEQTDLRGERTLLMHVNQHDAQLERLGVLIAQLEEKLDPILLPNIELKSVDDTTVRAVAEPRSVIANQLLAQSVRLEETGVRIHRLTLRVEL